MRFIGRLRPKVSERRVPTTTRRVCIAGILMLLAGCRSGHRNDGLLDRLSSVNQLQATTLGPNHLAAEGMATILAGCEKESFENARSGLIVSQTGLHEDVFALRSGTSYASIALSLDDALKLENVPRKHMK
jgi:hypothetical protein